ncbi:MAG TPA: sigma-70 family RNA polymerase sigma factor [Ktedonobacterales bacterium]
MSLRGKAVPHDITGEFASQPSTPGEQRSTGRPGGLRALYEETLPAIYHFIYGKVGNREEAEDLTSQVYLKALNGLDQTRDADSVHAWLFQVARTTIADYWRGFYRLRSSSLDDLLAAGWDSPETAGNARSEAGAEVVPAAARAQRILARLPERYRDVLALRFLQNLSLRETAARMNLTEANVKVLQFRALRRASQFNDASDNHPDHPPSHDQSSETRG